MSFCAQIKCLLSNRNISAKLFALNRDVSDCVSECGMVVAVTWADLLGCFHITISRIYREWAVKCLLDFRGEENQHALTPKA